MMKQLDRLYDDEIADYLKKYMFYSEMLRNLDSNNVNPCLRIFDISKATIS